MKTSDFGYNLPEGLIAQEPWPERDRCKMLVLDKSTGQVEDKFFYQIEEYFNSGDLLIANETRVLPARLLGKKRETGGNAEILLLKNVTKNFQSKTTTETQNVSETNANNSQYWEALVKPGKRLKPANLSKTLGTTLSVAVGNTGPIVDFTDVHGKVVLSAEVVDWATGNQPGMRTVRLFSEKYSADDALHKIGKTPLPPYIHNYAGNMEMYQTVYSANESSAAAPTAGLHFTNCLIDRLKTKGVNFETVELEVGIDTFRPVDEEDPRDHKMHTELYTISPKTIQAIERTKAEGNRVIAVGTTSVRTLESSFDNKSEKLIPCLRKPTSLFILPGYKYNVVDAMITNFHVPESTLMMLVSAFGGYENIMRAYKHAVEARYRFLSFGDAMFIY